MSLVEACTSGDLERVKEFLDRGANIHALNDYPLRWSGYTGHVEVVRLLLDRGADIHALNDLALRWSAQNGRLEVVGLLLDRGANIHANDDDALRFSARGGHLEVVRLLLDRGANIHAQDDYALRSSAHNGYVEVVRLLLDRGALLSYGIIKRFDNSYIKLMSIYIHDDSLFVKKCRVFGVLRRHVHSLEELCKKAILVYGRSLPDKIEEIDFELSVKTLKSMI
jgi:ankyrin repeat protein